MGPRALRPPRAARRSARRVLDKDRPACMQGRSFPLFALYLVLLMHNYFIGLVSRRPGPTAVAATPVAPGASRYFRVLRTLGAAMVWMLARGMQLAAYLDTVCNEATFPPHCLLIHVQVPSSCYVTLRHALPHSLTPCHLGTPVAYARARSDSC